MHTGWIDRHDFLRWREAYEAAGIDDQPPQELRAMLGGNGTVVASDTPRGIESARALAPDRELVTSELLRELELAPPNIRWIRLPLFGWALMYGPQWLIHLARGQSWVPAAEGERIDAAARWIEQLAETHSTVFVVTHASFRRQLSHALKKRGWTKESHAGGWRHWSAWMYVR